MITIHATSEDNRSLTPIEAEAWARFEGNDRRGRALFHPPVDPDAVAPH